MVTQNAISPELPADVLAKSLVISDALRGPTTHRIGSSVARLQRGSRYLTNNRAWRQTIQIALPLAGPVVGLVALLAIGLVQG